MSSNHLPHLQREFDAFSLGSPKAPPPTYNRVTQLILFLHTLEAVRRHVAHQADEILTACSGELLPAEFAELTALKAGASHTNAIERWVGLTFSWRRWALSTAQRRGATEASQGGKLFNNLLSPDSLAATGFEDTQLDFLALFEQQYAAGRVSVKVKIAPLWELTKDWAGRIILYARAIEAIREHIDRAGEPSSSPSPPPPPPAPQIKIQPSPNSANKRKRTDAPPSPRRSTRSKTTRSPSPPKDTLAVEEEFEFAQSQSILFDREETPPASTAPNLSPKPSPARSNRSVRFADDVNAQAEPEAVSSESEMDNAAAIEQWIEHMPADNSTATVPARATTPPRPSQSQSQLGVPYESPMFMSSPADAFLSKPSPRTTRAQSKSPAHLAPPLDAPSSQRLRTSPRRVAQQAALNGVATKQAGEAFHAKMSLLPPADVSSSPGSTSTRVRPSSARASMSPAQTFTEYAAQLETQLLTQAPPHLSALESQQTFISEDDEMAAASSRNRRSSTRLPTTPGQPSNGGGRSFDQVVSSASASWTSDAAPFLEFTRREHDL